MSKKPKLICSLIHKLRWFEIDRLFETNYSGFLWREGKALWPVVRNNEMRQN